jgi:hypothetical protein
LFAVGEIIHFYRRAAGKPKYYLCVSKNGHYVYLNTSRKYYADAFVFDCSRLPLPASDTGKSSVSCGKVMQFSDGQLEQYKAKSCGPVGKAFLVDLVEFAETCEALSQEDKEYIIGGISDEI